MTLLKQRVDFSIGDGNFGINLFIDTVTEVSQLGPVHMEVGDPR